MSIGILKNKKMLSKGNISTINKYKTPFYYYDLSLLQQTLDVVKAESSKYNYHVHYAFKANTNSRIIELIQKSKLGADCVSGNEVKCAIENGFNSAKIVFAGVGKSDDEINYALDKNIFCFNCESMQELEVLNELAILKNKVASIALRILAFVKSEITPNPAPNASDPSGHGSGSWTRINLRRFPSRQDCSSTA